MARRRPNATSHRRLRYGPNLPRQGITERTDARRIIGTPQVNTRIRATATGTGTRMDTPTRMGSTNHPDQHEPPQNPTPPTHSEQSANTETLTSTSEYVQQHPIANLE